MRRNVGNRKETGDEGVAGGSYCGTRGLKRQYGRKLIIGVRRSGRREQNTGKQ